mgnify:CR=1 FL=1
MRITKDRAMEIIDTQEPVSQGTWRWGHTSTYVFQEGDKHFAFVARFHCEEGIQDMDRDVDCYEVEPVEEKRIKWVRVPFIAPQSKPAILT